MSDDKKERISKIIKQLADLPAEKREELSSRLGIINPEGHLLTPRNQCLIYFQNIDNVSISVVAGYKQWQKFQRQVKKGSHGFLIAVPSGQNNQEKEEEPGEVYFFYKTVFDISQTEELSSFN
jgi:N-terminal domain of anti-restriction factor ArdC